MSSAGEYPSMAGHRVDPEQLVFFGHLDPVLFPWPSFVPTTLAFLEDSPGQQCNLSVWPSQCPDQLASGFSWGGGWTQCDAVVSWGLHLQLYTSHRTGATLDVAGKRSRGPRSETPRRKPAPS
jgi:hypothetical protein